MRKKWLLRAVSALTAITLFASCDTLYSFADEDETNADTDTSDTSDTSSTTKSKRTEATEEYDISPTQVTKYMTKMNSVDGITFYARPDDYKDLSDDNAVAAMKKAEIAGIDDDTGKVVCTLEKEDKGSGYVAYVSEEGRWLVYTDEDGAKVTMVRKIVSLLDNEYLFLSLDNQTLEQYDDDYALVRTYIRSGTDDGNIVYSNTDEWRVELSSTFDEVISCARFVCENDNLALYLDDDRAVIGLYDKNRDKMWWSTPESVGHDTVASNTIVSDLSSSLKMVYGEPDARNTTTMRSDSDSTTKITEITNGIEIDYTFSKAGIMVPVTYTLGEDYLEARVETCDIEEETTDKITTSLTLMGNFGAASSTDEGYFVIPDGSGALINFNNGKTTSKSYTGYVYGSDVTAVSTTQPAVTQQIYLPMYGIVNGNDALMVVCTEGDSNAKILASVSGQSNSSFNTCGFEFTLRDSDTYYMSGDSSTALTMFETGDIKTEAVAVRYYPLQTDDNPDYVDVAAAYREYLIDEEGLGQSSTASEDPKMTLSLYGGVMKEQSIAGVPISRKTSLTTFEQAAEILYQLQDDGVDTIDVQYYNWTNAGIQGKIDVKAKAAKVLGGSDDWSALLDFAAERNITIYPATDNETFYSGKGYYTFTDTCVRISGSYARIYPYNLAYGTQSSDEDAKSLLTPASFDEVYTKLKNNYTKAGLTCASLGSMTSALYGDYGKKSLSRDDAMSLYEGVYDDLTGSGISLLADTANAYALPYVSEIVDVPLYSSEFDVFDENIPFYQLVMHGVMDYSSTAINSAATPSTEILYAVACGSNLQYDMIGEETSTLKDTDLEDLYYAQADTWLDFAAGAYAFEKDVLSGLGTCTITGYDIDGSVITTTYSDGTVIVTDLNAGTVSRDGRTYVLSDYIEDEGGNE